MPAKPTASKKPAKAAKAPAKAAKPAKTAPKAAKAPPKPAAKKPAAAPPNLAALERAAHEHQDPRAMDAPGHAQVGHDKQQHAGKPPAPRRDRVINWFRRGRGR